MSPRFLDLSPRAAPRALAVALTVLLAAAPVFAVPQAATAEQPPPAEAIPSAQPMPLGLRNAPLAAHRKELLDFAFRTATLVPAWPHIKTRSLLQEQVVVECFELDQPVLALGYIKRIDNWRRAAAYADLAYYLAQKGESRAVEGYLDLARQQVDEMTEEASEEDDEAIESFQSWRRDRVRAKIARALLALGEPGRAIEFAEGLEASESGIVEAAQAKGISEDEAMSQAMVLDVVGTDGDLNRIRNALKVGFELLERFWHDETKRSLFLQKLESCIHGTPVVFRFDFMTALAETVLEHGDEERALRLLLRAEQGLAIHPIAPEDDIPLRARLAALRFRAGRVEQARTEIDAALEAFEAAREKIVDLRRADALLPIAEAFVTLGDESRALEIYTLAAVEGAENPNPIPRVEDLVALCCSLARHGVPPDAELWRRIEATSSSVNGPW